MPERVRTNPVQFHILAHYALKVMSGGWTDFERRDALLHDPAYLPSLIAGVNSSEFLDKVMNPYGGFYQRPLGDGQPGSV